MNQFPVLDETKSGFDPAAITSERAKAETATVGCFMGINA